MKSHRKLPPTQRRPAAIGDEAICDIPTLDARIMAEALKHGDLRSCVRQPLGPPAERHICLQQCCRRLQRGVVDIVDDRDTHQYWPSVPAVRAWRKASLTVSTLHG